VADFDHTRLDEVIHSRLRLAIMTALAAVERAEFTFLRDQVKATDGNLGSHLRKLEDAGYVTVRKRIVGRKPVSDYRLTARGRQALDEYLGHLSAMVGRGL
jgi:DNA-binding transcriptional ArsR family regulator